MVFIHKNIEKTLGIYGIIFYIVPRFMILTNIWTTKNYGLR